jgi:hypothetical protein
MLCDVTEAAWYLGYASPASLYRLLKAGLLDDYVEDYKGQVLLRMGSKGRFPTLARRVRSLVNFKGGHEMFMFDPKEPDSIQRMRDRYEMKRQQKLTTKQA